ncbi:flavin-containing monooxygenase [Paenibacillus provencensis]|uniref:Flavin-containing monooxygenase n=1 Tax=Paenibacillus provencensis TaxID=441151 RepID=A0ABW3Q1T0_9BACL
MYDVIIIGGGQAGLVSAYYLKQNAINFLILDSQKEIGDSWRSRYDSLHLFTPRMYSSLPGMDLVGDSQGLPHKDELANYLRDYAQCLEFPIQENTRVLSLKKEEGTFKLITTQGEFISKNVIVATGPFQKPHIPLFNQALSDSVIQLHSSIYKNEKQLKKGVVLVVGAGNSGAQIACELASNYEVHLSASGNINYKPLHILGRSIFWYFNKLGFLTAHRKSTLGKWLYKQPEQIYGKELELLIKQDKIKLHLRTNNIHEDQVYFENEETPIHIDNVIWATGFKRDDQWIDINEAFQEGKIEHSEGISVVEGLYFVGLPWQTCRGSALVGWGKYDAQRIVDHIVNHKNS